MATQVHVAPVIVLPLKVLATREVIRERIDYKDYLGGNVREELDRLNGFEGFDRHLRAECKKGRQKSIKRGVAVYETEDAN